MESENKRIEEFIRLFEKATGKRLGEDEARSRFERIMLLYRVLLRGR